MKLVIGNAACMVRSMADVHPLLAIPSDILSFITLGSYTLHERAGNEGETFWEDGCAWPSSLNARGMPNRGYNWLRTDEFSELVDAIRASGKRARISMAGFNPQEYAALTNLVASSVVDEIELNLGCPNTGHRIVSFDPQAVADVVSAVWEVTDHLGAPSIAYKFSPYSDSALLKEIAAVMTEAPNGAIQGVVTCNTFPNCSSYQNGKLTIGANNGYAGLGGDALKHIALGQVRQFRDALPDRIEVIGVGGVSCWSDVRDLYLAGASRVQVATSFVVKGARIFSDIAHEYAASDECEAA